MSESQNIEWKTSWRDDYFKWICGFANAQGGVLEVGKNDKGEVVGVKNVLRLLEEIPNKALALLGIVVDVNLKAEDGGEYIEIVVEPHPNPISYKGKIYYRSGSTKQVLKGAALSRFLLKKYGRTWDDAPLPGVRLKDLDRHALNSFRRGGAATKHLPRDILKESDSEVIERLQLREADSLKRAAVLLFHPRPHRFVMGACVKIGYFRGSELLYQNVVEGSLFTQVDRTMDLLYSKVHAGVDFLRRRLPGGNIPGAERSHARGGDQRRHPPGLRQSHHDSDSRIRRSNHDVERRAVASRLGRDWP